MDIKIELLGYKGTLTHMASRIAHLPWQKEDELLAYIDFEEPLPASIISTAISIPVKDYSREEFLKIVKEEGEKQLTVSLETYQRKQEAWKQEIERREELEALAKSFETKFEEKEVSDAN